MEYEQSPIKSSVVFENLSFKYHDSSKVVPKQLIQQEIESDEYFFNPGWFSPLNEVIYRLNDDEQVIEENISANIYSLIIYTPTISENYQRAIYTSLDFLGDVGGLWDGLHLIASTILGLLS